jgi:CspA family cold shock protein
MEGKIKFFNEQKGYGFIACTDDVDYFVHVTDCIDKPKKGDYVTFVLENGDRGVKAVDIRVKKDTVLEVQNGKIGTKSKL